MPQVISIGEVMVQLNPVSGGPLRHARLFERHVAGSEANTLVGMGYLGVTTRLISRVGDDEFGLAVLSELRAGGVDVSYVKRDPEAPTAVYFVQRGYPVQDKTKVLYYRRGSAASRMSSDDVTEDALTGCELVHVTGITPVLSASCKHACLTLVDLARRKGIPVVFDTNIRITLWRNREAALAGLMPFLEGASYLFTGRGDLDFLFGPGELEDQVEKVRKMASEAKVIVVKQGSQGASLFTSDGSVRHSGYRVEVVDELGAGDAFVAAFLASILRGDNLGEALKYANAAGALAVTVRGDLEPLPTWGDLELFISQHEGGEGILLR